MIRVFTFVTLRYFTFILIILLFGCDNSRNDRKPSPTIHDRTKLNDALIKANKSATSEEFDMMARYVNRHGWLNPIVNNGVIASIYESHEGTNVNNGDLVFLSYSIGLISGKMCYQTPIGNPKSFVVGKSGNEVIGLHYALLLLKEKERAKIIIPSHLGYGLSGDQNLIPPKSTLIYDVYVERVVSAKK